MRRVLVLGGGFGGVAAAHALRQHLPAEDEVVLVERRPYFLLGLRKNWVLAGRGTLEEGRRPLSALARFGIRVVAGTITAIDPASRRVTVDGQQLEGDAMVVALGAALAPDQVPGFRDHAFNIYDPEEVPRAAEALRTFRGGRIVIGIFGAPYKCPPAPYELAFLLQETLQERGVPATLEVFTPQPMSIPLLGPASCTAIEGRLAARGIRFLPAHRATAVENGAVVFGNERHPFDLLLGVPPHRCPEVVVQSGLTEGGDWVRVNPRTLETRFPSVYAIGDITEVPMANGMPLPKAGIFAEAEAAVVAARIAATFSGQPATATFDGSGYCFLEVGHREAMLVRGRFLAEPKPEVEIAGPSPAFAADKVQFEAERLRRWFGA